ncbi:MAG TPA: HAMP domain-containing sensor histidine kinase [Ignavibacteriaceae bacterium]|nr:HAMP domain-containing sensor histidine kinase [Ignavibacteriaceae bacterium]
MNKLILLVDTILFFFLALGLYQIIEKKDLSKSFKSSNIIISKINNIKVSSWDDIEVILDISKNNNYAKVDYYKDSLLNQQYIKLVPFYSLRYSIIALLAGFIFIFTALLVLIKSQDKKAANIFHWASIATATIILTTWGYTQNTYFILTLITRILFHLAYTLVPILFLHFALSFPEDVSSKYKYQIFFLYTTSILLTTLLTITFILSINNLLYVDSYVLIFNLVRNYVILLVLLSVYNFYRSYKRSNSYESRKKIKWIAYGLIIGPLSFILLWVLPQFILNKGLIQEEYVLILISIVPISFALSIIKYHALDIDVIVNRSIVYFIVIGIISVCYTILIYSLSKLLSNNEDYILFFMVLVIAIAFQPIKSKVQSFVDKKFFKINYNYRLAVNNFYEVIKNSNTINDLSTHLINNIQKFIPTRQIIFFFLDEDTNVSYSNNLNAIKVNPEYLYSLSISIQEHNFAAIPNRVESKIMVDNNIIPLLQNLDLKLAVPFKISTNNSTGFLGIGDKISGHRINIEDIDLLTQVSFESRLTIEKILLQEAIINERIKTFEEKEINDMKSFFISNVSHELKTPITSIKLYSELMQINKEFTSENNLDYLKIIEGESNRLTRLIDNLLDLSKIEKGIKTYNFVEINLSKLLCYCINLMEYLVKIEKVEVLKNIEEPIYIVGDPDSIVSLFTNLISNAIKYAQNPKKIEITMINKQDNIEFSIQDNGQGLTVEEIKNIFRPYYRTEKAARSRIKGTGIGLYLVEEIVKAHKGQIKILSNLNSGCKFIINLPKETIYEENINN